ncbi:MAG TPA: hypothetical protein VIO94_16005 [Phenylobacterium sp.]
MSLARRMLFSSASTLMPGQVEYTQPGRWYFLVPDGVTEVWAVGIAGGSPGLNTSPFHGGTAGNLHWNSFEVTPGEVFEIQVGTGARTQTLVDGVLSGWTYVRRDSDNYVIRARRSTTTLDHLTLGGGGGQGGSGGIGHDGNGGLGGGGPGYTGQGGKGGNYYGQTNGQMPEVDSGGGRGGDSDGVPYGYQGESGEGTGLFGRSADKSTSLGDKLYGAGAFATSSGGRGGGVRLMWGGGRSYPDNAPDVPSNTVAEFITESNGSGTPPIAFTVDTNGAAPGDLALFYNQVNSSGSGGGISGGDGQWMNDVIYFKQLTQNDLDASDAGTLLAGGTGARTWGATVYRGPVRAVQRTLGGSPSDTVVVPGFTKRIDCKRVVLIVTDADAGGAIAVPAGFTQRISRTSPLRLLIADAAPGDYADGASVTLTGMGASTASLAYLFELY